MMTVNTEKHKKFREPPDYLYQKMLMILGDLLVVQGLLLGTIRFNLFNLFEIGLGLCLFWVGVWLIDWEAKFAMKRP